MFTISSHHFNHQLSKIYYESFSFFMTKPASNCEAPPLINSLLTLRIYLKCNLMCKFYWRNTSFQIFLLRNSFREIHLWRGESEILRSKWTLPWCLKAYAHNFYPTGNHTNCARLPFQTASRNCIYLNLFSFFYPSHVESVSPCFCYFSCKFGNMFLNIVRQQIIQMWITFRCFVINGNYAKMEFVRFRMIK